MIFLESNGLKYNIQMRHYENNLKLDTFVNRVYLFIIKYRIQISIYLYVIHKNILQLLLNIFVQIFYIFN